LFSSLLRLAFEGPIGHVLDFGAYNTTRRVLEELRKKAEAEKEPGQRWAEDLEKAIKLLNKTSEPSSPKCGTVPVSWTTILVRILKNSFPRFSLKKFGKTCFTGSFPVYQRNIYEIHSQY